jgi:hypothetical protein
MNRSRTTSRLTDSNRNLFLRSDVIGALNQTVVPGCGRIREIHRGGSLTGEIDLYQPAAGASNPLFATDQFGTDIEMKGNVYAALSLQLSVEADVGGDRAPLRLRWQTQLPRLPKSICPSVPMRRARIQL